MTLNIAPHRMAARLTALVSGSASGLRLLAILLVALAAVGLRDEHGRQRRYDSSAR